MKRRIVSLAVLLAMLVTFIPNVFAEQEAQVPEGVQAYILTDPIFENKGIVEISCVDDHYVVIPQSGYHLVVDPFGNQIFPMGSYWVQNYFGKILSVSNGSKLAIFDGKRQLTDFLYVQTEKVSNLIRATRPDGSNDFYWADTGKKISVPKAPSGWTIYNLFGEKAMLLRRERTDVAHNRFVYRVCDWSGNVIYETTNGYEIKKVSDSLFYSDIYNGSYIGINGKLLVSGHVSLDRMPSGNHYFIEKGFYYTPPNPEYSSRWTHDMCYLYDEDLNLVTTFNDIKYTSKVILRDDLVFFTLEDGSSVIMNTKGETLQSWQSATCTIAESDKIIIGKDERWGFVIETQDECTLYDMQMNTILTVENVKSFDVANDLMIVYTNDGKQLLYSKDGALLFSREEGSHVKCKDGVLYEKTEEGYVFVGLNGEKVGEHVYEKIAESGTCSIGLLSAQRYDKWYLVNAAGIEQNERGFAESVSFKEWNINLSNSITVYRIGNKYGIISYYPKERPIQSSFTDVYEWDWYLEAVEYCLANKLFSGTAPGIFEPNSTMTRAMLVTVLWRLEGEPSAQTQAAFTDVDSGKWYADAVSWAAENGIVNGMSEKSFQPNGNVTREQIATIMLRYAQYKNYDTENRADISAYPDANKVSDYAKDAMSWANAAGLISGSNENGKVLLIPQGNATRAQVAVILMRFVEAFAK